MIADRSNDGTNCKAHNSPVSYIFERLALHTLPINISDFVGNRAKVQRVGLLPIYARGVLRRESSHRRLRQPRQIAVHLQPSWHPIDNGLIVSRSDTLLNSPPVFAPASTPFKFKYI
jgi:hypothetical protein